MRRRRCRRPCRRCRRAAGSRSRAVSANCFCLSTASRLMPDPLHAGGLELGARGRGSGRPPWCSRWSSRPGRRTAPPARRPAAPDSRRGVAVLVGELEVGDLVADRACHHRNHEPSVSARRERLRPIRGDRGSDGPAANDEQSPYEDVICCQPATVPTSPATTPQRAPTCCTSSPTTSPSISPTAAGSRPSARSARPPRSASPPTRPGESTFIDVIADRFHAVTAQRRRRRRLGLPPRGRHRAAPTWPPTTSLVVDADLLYTNTGEGLHRFVDPLDGEVYLYSQFETADAKRMYACFDQPDLKADLHLHVTVPDALGGRLQRRRLERRGRCAPARRVHFATTRADQPLHHRAGRRAVPRRRATTTTASTSACGAARRWPSTSTPTSCSRSPSRASTGTTPTSACGTPFGKYDQLFVPEFNAGAMENAGCVTFREDYVFRSKVTDARYERRAETILHEMAHMWFGDLVTMRWWDDLWLNESFADLRLGAVPDRGHPLDRRRGRPSPTSRRPGPTGRTSCPRRTRSPPTPPTCRPPR